MARSNATPEEVLARKAIRSMLEGEPLEGISVERCGPWADAVAALSDAHARGGTEAARQAFNALARADAGLLRLVSGSSAQRKETWTVAELYDTEFPEPRWAVPGIIPVGPAHLNNRVIPLQAEIIPDGRVIQLLKNRDGGLGKIEESPRSAGWVASTGKEIFPVAARGDHQECTDGKKYHDAYAAGPVPGGVLQAELGKIDTGT